MKQAEGNLSDPIKYIYSWILRITSRVDLAMSVCPYERWDLGNYTSYNTKNRHADSWEWATPTLTPTITAQNCGSYSFDARKKMKKKDLKCVVLINTYRLTQKKVRHAHVNAISHPQTWKNRKYEHRYFKNYQR